MPTHPDALAPVLVIIPTYREAANLPMLWEALNRLPVPIDMLIVDDGSDDGSRPWLQRRVCVERSVTVIQRGCQLGLGTAYTLALAYARGCGYSRVIQMDADFSHDPCDLPRLLQACRQEDMAIGSRYAPGGGVCADWPWWRRQLSAVANRLVALALGLPIRDATGGFRCTRGALLQTLPLDHLLSVGFGWQWEFNRLVLMHGARVGEVPIQFRQRQRGQSKMSLRVMVEGLLRLVQIRFVHARGHCGVPRGKLSSHPPCADASPTDRQVLSRREACQRLVWMTAGVSVASLVAGTPGDGARGRQEGVTVIERMYVDRANQHDPGTVIGILRHPGGRPLVLEAVTVNGRPLKDWPGPTDPIAWHRVSRQALGPGESALLVAKLAQYTAGLLRIGIVAGGQASEALVTASAPETVRIAAVRFDPSGRRVNLFIENRGTTAEQVRSVTINHQTVWRAPSPPRSLTVPPLGLAPLRVTLADTLKAGRRLDLVVELADRRIGATHRAIAGFRLSVEAGDQQMAQRIAADPLVLQTYQFTEEPVQQTGEAAPALAARLGSHWSMVKVSHGKFLSKQQSDLACVFACPTHSTDSYQTAAYLAMTAQQEVDGHPQWQSFIHCCRTQVLRGIAVFGSIADGVRFNAALDTEIATRADHRDQNPAKVYALTRYAVETAAPSVAIPMIMLQRDWKIFPFGAPLAVEARQMIYAAVAAGAGGVSYRVRQEDWGNENRERMLDAVEQANREIRQVRDLLAMSYPCPTATLSCEDAWVQAACLDALPRGLLVLLINHDLERPPPELPPSVRAVEHRDVVVRVELPPDFPQESGEGRVFRVRGDNRSAVDSVRWEPGRLTITTPSLTDTALYIIEPPETREEHPDASETGHAVRKVHQPSSTSGGER